AHLAVETGQGVDVGPAPAIAGAIAGDDGGVHSRSDQQGIRRVIAHGARRGQGGSSPGIRCVPRVVRSVLRRRDPGTTPARVHVDLYRSLEIPVVLIEPVGEPGVGIVALLDVRQNLVRPGTACGPLGGGRLITRPR